MVDKPQYLGFILDIKVITIINIKRIWKQK